MKPKIMWAVINTESNDICFTGTVINEDTSPDFINTGAAIFETRQEAWDFAKKLNIHYCKTFKVKIIKA